MARLISWPAGLVAYPPEPLSGPRSVGAASTESLGAFLQTSAAAFGSWRWRFTFPPIRGEAFRRYRGWVTALHGGANATRVPFADRDALSVGRRGIEIPATGWCAGLAWSHGLGWDNGANWRMPTPTVPLDSPAALGATEVRLADAFWGAGLDAGDFVGFEPFHFGLYMVTQAIEPGRYRIWPPLRKALAADDRATLSPVLAMRLEGEAAATAARGASHADGLSVTLVEVPDADVKTYFAD